MNPEQSHITLSARSVVVIVVAIVSAVFAAGGWASWAAGTLVEIRDGSSKMRSEMERTRELTETRLQKLEIDNIKIKSCLTYGNGARCKID